MLRLIVSVFLVAGQGQDVAPRVASDAKIRRMLTKGEFHKVNARGPAAEKLRFSRKGSVAKYGRGAYGWFASGGGTWKVARGLVLLVMNNSDDSKTRISWRLRVVRRKRKRRVCLGKLKGRRFSPKFCR